MEKALIWAKAQADDLQDAEGLYETARKMKALGDTTSMNIFINRAKTHISYVEENGWKIYDLVADVEDAGCAPNSFEDVYLKVLKQAQNDRIACLKIKLNEL